MKCPECGYERSKVQNVKHICRTEEGCIKRYRVCLRCGARFPTIEMHDNVPLAITYSAEQED